MIFSGAISDDLADIFRVVPLDETLAAEMVAL
jgi:hypothetical protein